jgi:hypothetical protein
MLYEFYVLYFESIYRHVFNINVIGCKVLIVNFPALAAFFQFSYIGAL